jgi:hypothetical protein
MTRTDVMASSGPQTTAPRSTGSLRARRRLRWLAAPAILLLALALAAPTLAATSTNKEGLSGYSTTPTTPKSGTAPSKSTEPATKPAKTTPTPATEPAPARASSVPTTTPKSSTLPFTGFDLRWTVGGGLLLMAMGFSIVTIQRRERRGNGR